MNIENVKLRVSLLLAKVEILKLKADHYNWFALTPEIVREQIEASLVEIDNTLLKLKEGAEC